MNSGSLKWNWIHIGTIFSLSSPVMESYTAQMYLPQTETLNSHESTDSNSLISLMQTVLHSHKAVRLHTGTAHAVMGQVVQHSYSPCCWGRKALPLKSVGFARWVKEKQQDVRAEALSRFHSETDVYPRFSPLSKCCDMDRLVMILRSPPFLLHSSSWTEWCFTLQLI